MVHGEKRIPYWIDRRLTGLAGPEYHAIISFGLPIEPEDSQYGKYRLICEEAFLILVVESVVDLASELIAALVQGEHTVDELDDCGEPLLTVDYFPVVGLGLSICNEAYVDRWDWQIPQESVDEITLRR